MTVLIEKPGLTPTNDTRQRTQAFVSYFDLEYFLGGHIEDGETVSM
jgi:hypothetical protein